jgi:hypothetical protein
MGHVPADWESTPRESSPEEDYDWEAMLATALGIAAPAPVTLPDVDVDAVAGAAAAEMAPDMESVLLPTPSEPETESVSENTVPTIVAAAELTPWSGDDILPHRRNGQKRRRFFGR